ncbi:MAG: lipopolysaccharide biosynthesis protein, partial [Candidatus Kapaibacterium sp.]
SPSRTPASSANREAIPRTFCLKVLLRDSQMKQVFWTDFAWFGTMTVMTAWMLLHQGLGTFSDMAAISCAGIGVSSLVSFVLARKLVPLTLRNLPSLPSYYRFGLVQIGIAGVTNAVRQLDTLLLQFFFHDLAFLGMYYSAKTFFRVFETGLDALFSIIYPTAVRLLPQGKDEEFKAVLSKGISYLFLSYVAAVIVLELGGTQILVSLLGGKYVNVAGQFNVMVLAALFLPFTSLYSVLLAENRNLRMLVFVSIATVCATAVFAVSGMLRQQWLFPMGIVTYNAIIAVALYGAVRHRLGLRVTMFLRAVPDVLNYLRHRRPA